MIKTFFYRVFCGFFLGLSVVAPGFSGSIIAIIMGIYQDLLRIVSNPFKEFKKNVIFCLPLAIGAGISAVLFILALKHLFETYEKATYLLFVGLVAGNLPLIFSDVRKSEFKKRYLIGGVGAFAAALALGILAMNIAPATSHDVLSINWITMTLGGIAGGATALVPGMSVTVVLMIFGIYRPLIIMAESLVRFDFTYLIPFGVFGICAVAGLVATSTGIKKVFDKHPAFANTTVFGFISGSLIGILVRSLMMTDASFNWIIGGVMLLAGLGISMLFVVLGKKMKKEGAEG